MTLNKKLRPIAYLALKEHHASASQAFDSLKKEAQTNYPKKLWGGTIAVCELRHEINKPRNIKNRNNILDALNDNECVWYEERDWYMFIGKSFDKYFVRE